MIVGAPARGEGPQAAAVDGGLGRRYASWVVPSALRLLLPIVAALTLLAQPVVARAAAGLVGDTACCCPDPRTCDCHDHQGHGHDDQRMKRCGNDVVKLVAPVLLTALRPPAPPALVPPRRAIAPTFVPVALPERRPDRPEKPPG